MPTEDSNTLEFIVIEHNENHKIKKGELTDSYRIKLESSNGKFQIGRKSENSAILDEFPIGAHIAINMRMARQEVFPTP